MAAPTRATTFSKTSDQCCKSSPLRKARTRSSNGTSRNSLARESVLIVASFRRGCCLSIFAVSGCRQAEEKEDKSQSGDPRRTPKPGCLF
jgi:hypothetical protein